MTSQLHSRLETFFSGDDLNVAEKVIAYFRTEDIRKHPSGYMGVTYEMIERNFSNVPNQDLNRVFGILSSHGFINRKRKGHYHLGVVARNYH